MVCRAVTVPTIADAERPHQTESVTESTPIIRALRALELLQREPGISGDRLAAELDVSTRAVRRTIQSLRDAEIPIAATPGPLGGYRLGAGARAVPVVLRSAEALALVMAVAERRDADERSDVADAAVRRLLGAMPTTVAAPARSMLEHTASIPEATSSPRVVLAMAVVDAVAERERLRIRYRSAAGASWSEQVEPWAVVVRHGRWYLLCRSLRADDVRTYRLDRIDDAVGTRERFVPPPSLDARALLEEHLGSGRPYRTRIVLHAPIDEVRPWWSPVLGTLTSLDASTCLLEGTTSNPAMIAGEWLAALPFAATVEGDEAVRAAVAGVVQRLSAALEPCRARPAR